MTPDLETWVVAISAAVQALTAVVIVGFTLWLVILNKGLLVATWGAANAAKESAQAATAAVGLARLESRAWVGIKAVRAHREIEHLRGAHIGFTAEATNTGKTPALNLEGWWVIYRTPNE